MDDELIVYSLSFFHLPISPSPHHPLLSSPLKGGGKGWGLHSLDLYQAKESVGFY